MARLLWCCALGRADNRRVRECLRYLATSLIVGVPIAVVTPLVMLLVLNVFFDGLYVLDPVTNRLGSLLTFALYVLAWSAAIGLITWAVRRRLHTN